MGTGLVGSFAVELRDSLLWAGRVAVIGKLAWSIVGLVRHRK